jgi:hypothetical protein
MFTHFVSVLSEKFPPKPKQRFSLGTEFEIWVNHFRMRFEPFTVHQYDVKIYGGAKPKPIESKAVGM